MGLPYPTEGDRLAKTVSLRFLASRRGNAVSTDLVPSVKGLQADCVRRMPATFSLLTVPNTDTFQPSPRATLATAASYPWAQVYLTAPSGEVTWYSLKCSLSGLNGWASSGVEKGPRCLRFFSAMILSPARA